MVNGITCQRADSKHEDRFAIGDSTFLFLTEESEIRTTAEGLLRIELFLYPTDRLKMEDAIYLSPEI